MAEHESEGFSFKESLKANSEKLDRVIDAIADLKEAVGILPEIRQEVAYLKNAIFDPETGVRPRVGNLEMRLQEQIDACKNRRALEQKIETVQAKAEDGRRDARRTWWTNIIGWLVVLATTLIAVYFTRR